MIKYYEGDCPTTGKIHQIAAEYRPINVIGQMHTQYKLVSFECSLAAIGRSSLSNPDDCPILKTIPRC